MAQVVQTWLEAASVIPINLREFAETPKCLLGKLNGYPVTGVAYEERRTVLVRMTEALPGSGIALKNGRKVAADRNEPVLVILAGSDLQQQVDEINIRDNKPDCFADPKCCAVEYQEHSLQRMRLQLAQG